jgi:hypothetical protein
MCSFLEGTFSITLDQIFNLPEAIGFNYFAVDNNGSGFFYDKIPYLSFGEMAWKTYGKIKYRKLNNYLFYVDDYTKTLRKRPIK